MRKIVADLFVSLDGVVESPEQWTASYFSEDIGQMIGSEIAQADMMLLGQVTYQTFAASFASQAGGMADQMNTIPKIVVSTTLEAADWQNSTLVASPSELATYTRHSRTFSGGVVRLSYQPQRWGYPRFHRKSKTDTRGCVLVSAQQHAAAPARTEQE